MRKRAPRSAIMLATLLAWLLVTSDRASAEGFTVIVPVNLTNLHEDVDKMKLTVILREGTQTVGIGMKTTGTVVDQSVQEDVEVKINPAAGQNVFNADTYEIKLSVGLLGIGYCHVNAPYASDNACGDGRQMMQTYEKLSGPISDLIPE